jgi:transporter family-2 protein
MAGSTPYILFALLTGVAITVQTGVNAQLRQTMGSPLAATLVSFLVGTVLVMAMVALDRTPVPLRRLASAPWWMWTGGALGAFIVATNIVAAPRIGAALLMSLAVTGQLAASLVLDHYGAFAFPVHPISFGRIAGGVMLVGGVVLMRYA